MQMHGMWAGLLPSMRKTSLMKTLVMIKPDGVQKRCVGSTIAAIEQENLQISRIEIKTLGLTEAELLYAEHKGQWYFDRNIDHVTSGPVVIMQVEGENAVTKARQIVEQIREKHEIELPRNLIHASTGENEALEELLAVGF